jgi:hypothetical protein
MSGKMHCAFAGDEEIFAIGVPRPPSKIAACRCFVWGACVIAVLHEVTSNGFGIKLCIVRQYVWIIIALCIVCCFLSGLDECPCELGAIEGRTITVIVQTVRKSRGQQTSSSKINNALTRQLPVMEQMK